MSKPSKPGALPMWSCLRESDGGVVLDLSIVPGAKRTELVGLHDGALRVRLSAPPVDGRANDALIAWLADQLGVTRRDVELLRGASSRRKQLRVEVSPELARAWLERSLPEAS